jgi:hypothetical protein
MATETPTDPCTEQRRAAERRHDAALRPAQELTPKVQAKKRSVRRQDIVRRWLDILFAGSVGVAIVDLLIYWRPGFWGKIVTSPSWVFLAGGWCLFAFAYRFGRGRWLAFLGVRHPLTYPPVWFGATVGTVVVALTLPAISEQAWNAAGQPHSLLPVLAMCAFAAASGIMAVLEFIVVRGKQRRIASAKAADAGPNEQGLRFASFDELCRWLSTDDPVNAPDCDIFGHTAIANRMAERFRRERLSAQAVVGRLGAGKTTLRNLVGNALLRGDYSSPRVHLVPVELWPYETSRAAVQGIIGTLVDSLAREVNVLSVRGIPSAYAEAMTSAGGWSSAIVRLQGVPANPTETLTKIDRIATKIGLRFVLWIEDLERFAGGDQAEAGGEERLNLIRALLHGLAQLESVSVVTATTSLRMRFDIEKIARYVEVIPPLPDSLVSKSLALFRDGCRAKHDVIDPSSRDERSDWHNLGSSDYLAAREMFMGTGIRNAVDALVALCSTPRTMKQALRYCLDTWDRLAGEIDFDDVLVLSILRESAPDAVALIQSHIHYLRNRWTDKGRPSDKKKEEEKLSWQQRLKGALPSEEIQRPVELLVEFLFGEKHQSDSPQSVMQNNHANYWERFFSVPIIQTSERDQPILRVMQASDDEALISLLEDPSRSQAVHDFRRLLPAERPVRLFLPLISRRSRESATAWTRGDHAPPGLIVLWRLLLRQTESGELTGAAMLEQVKLALDLAIPANLALASSIEEHFVTLSADVTQLFNDEQKAEAKTYLRRNLVSAYQGKARQMAENLRGAEPAVLYWLCWGSDRARAKSFEGLPFEGWEQLAPTILEAARLNPGVMIPQLSVLLVKSSVSGMGRSTDYEFDSDLATRLFGKAGNLPDVFDKEEESQWPTSPWVQAAISGLKKVSAGSPADGPLASQ